MLTARGSKPDMVAALEAGANDYLIKPFDHYELRTRVEVGRRTIELQVDLMRVNERLQLAFAQHREEAARLEILAMAIDQAIESVAVTDREGTIEYINPAFEFMTGYSKEEIIGQKMNILKSVQQDPFIYNMMWETIRSGQTWAGTLVNRKKDGTDFTESLTITPVFNEAREIVRYVTVKRDITAEIKMKEHLSQSQRLDSIAQLAGGVAHDFNNTLGVIIGHVDLALELVSQENPIFESLHEIHKAAIRSASLTRQLLAFSRQQTIMPKTFDLTETIAGMLKMLSRLINEDVNLTFIPATILCAVKLDPSQLDQLLVNLVINARDAIDDTGSITIKTGYSIFSEDYCSTNPECLPGEFSWLSVKDTGCGMSKDTISHIFEPFFTTKEVGKSTGLGLATVFGIVQQNGGFIRVESILGEGTNFTIAFPRHALAAQKDVREPKEEHVCCGETILLVEDDPAILRLTQTLLERHGYTVLGANSGHEAIRLAEEHGCKINLLLTDVIMPEMNGRQVADAVSALCPLIKTLFMSGYPASVISRHRVLDEGINFIQKPFSLRDLVEAVKKTLSQEDPAARQEQTSRPL